MHKPRLISLRILAVVGLSALVFFLVLAVGLGGSKGGGGKSLQIAIVTNHLVPGARLAASDYVMADTTGWPPKLPSSVATTVSASYIGTDQINNFVGRMLVNNIFPGDVLSQSDFFVPRDAASCAADGTALTLASPTPAPGASAAPSAAPSKGGTSQAFAYRLSDLLCSNRRAIVLSADPTASFARPGDLVDVYLVQGNRGDSGTVQVVRMMTRRLLFVVQKIVPNDPTALNNFTPSGTIYVLDLSAQDVSDILWAQRDGDVRIAMARPDECAYNSGTSCSTGPVYTNSTTFQGTYIDTTPAPGASAAPGGGPLSPPSPAPSAEPSATPATSAAPVTLPSSAPTSIRGLIPNGATLTAYDEATSSLGYTTTMDGTALKSFYTAWAQANGGLKLTESPPGVLNIGGTTGLGATVAELAGTPTVVTIDFHLQ